jgi:hypothetical protein
VVTTVPPFRVCNVFGIEMVGVFCQLVNSAVAVPAANANLNQDVEWQVLHVFDSCQVTKFY